MTLTDKLLVAILVCELFHVVKAIFFFFGLGLFTRKYLTVFMRLWNEFKDKERESDPPISFDTLRS